MNYLVLTENDAFIQEIKNNIESIENNNSIKIIASDYKVENINKIKKHIEDICCAIVDISEKISSDLLENANYITGFFTALSIKIYSNLESLSQKPFINKNDISIYKDKEDLIKKLKKDFNAQIIENSKNIAKKSLISQGIPFTPDCCSLYISKNKPEIYNLFLDGGIDINSKDDLGTPILNIAVRNDNVVLVKKLIDMSVDINCVSDDRGYTPVMDAVWRGNKEIAELLIKNGADLNTINKEGQNNLVLAVGANKIEICELLAKNGANPDIKDSMGMSAYEYAKLFKKTEIIEILEKYHK